MLNVSPKDLLNRADKTAPVDRREAHKPRAWRPLPPSWRTCRLTMSRADFFAIAAAWIGALGILLAVALTFRWS